MDACHWERRLDPVIVSKFSAVCWLLLLEIAEIFVSAPVPSLIATEQHD
ncbi:hypothetical protein SynSYN20_00129 [Synechococcus sp. SYN20]|nr:hypothetical protein SynSYN20_00129 [Synechococcus sp. SYN20]